MPDMPASGIEYVKTIERVELMQSTFRFVVHFTDGTTAVTKAKSQVNYTIANVENVGVQVYVKAMPNGDIYSVSPVE